MLCKKQVAKSREGVECEIEIDYSLHQEVVCQATNKMGSASKPYDMVIYGKTNVFKIRWDLEIKLKLLNEVNEQGFSVMTTVIALKIEMKIFFGEGVFGIS